VHAMRDVLRFLAAWALVHESADEGWRAAVARGADLAPADLERGPDAFVDGLAALVDAEKERLKRELADGGARAAPTGGSRERLDADLTAALDAVRFEVAELRGRIDSLQASVDALHGERDD
jgi:hypothetical protein